jgi:hypothetical protein
MSYFNYIESLFLISLGITFVLILFLIYHFKQRITSLEQKTETMFGIVNSIVKDMRTFVQSSFQQVPPIPTTNISLQQEKVTTNKMEEHEDEEGDEEEEEDEDEEDEDEEDEDEVEDNNFKILVIKEDNDIILNGIEEVIAPETQQRNITPNEVFEEINVQVSSAETSVEVHSAEVTSEEVHSEEVTSEEVHSAEVHSAETSVEVTSEEVPQLKVTSVEVPSAEVPSAETSVEVTSEEVLQLKVTREESTEETITKEEKPTDEKLNYHKLHISELKKLVSTKKLTTQDISKLKKPELIKILEDSEN